MPLIFWEADGFEGGGGGYGTGGGGNGGAGSGGPAYNNMGGNQAQAANQRRF